MLDGWYPLSAYCVLDSLAMPGTLWMLNKYFSVEMGA